MYDKYQQQNINLKIKIMGIFDFFKKKKTELKGEEKPNKSEDSKPKEEVKPSE